MPTAAKPVLRPFGAVRTVTGSMHLVEANGDKLLLDCGLFQGKRAEAREKNKHFPFDPREITALVLSHAHIDHAGNIPNLVKQGFQGEVICTTATRDLAAIMLEDSASIQEKDAEHLNKKAGKRGRAGGGGDLVEPLYTVEDARRAAAQFRGVPYRYPVEVARGVRAEFRDAGHILGSASVGLTIEVPGGRARRLTFTGDVGRAGMPIIRDPEPCAAADLAITESTYGDRTHPPIDDQEARLEAVVRRTADRGGKLIVPAFSVGRTQNLVYYLHRLFDAKKLPPLPIYVDSPLSSRATQVYRAHPECYDEETQAAFLENGQDPFGFKRLTYVTAVEDSKALNDKKEPCIIIASSGMCEAGRILHHLKNNVTDARNTVLIVGFQAENTLGRRIVDRVETVKIYGEEYKLRAEVATLNGLSAHADREGLLDNFRGEGRVAARAVLVHGEVPQSEALAARLRDLSIEATIPSVGEAFEI
jgi:metallo-beta-lactamase family protein